MPTSYFDAMYEASEDPWSFTTRWYEQRKYALTLAALPQPRYASAYEPGCSIGVLTDALADRCDLLMASDAAAAAVAQASQRLTDKPWVNVECRVLPAQWPASSFELVVISELLYYFDDHDLAEVTGAAVASVGDGGTLAAVHWRHHVPDYPQAGDAVHDVLASAAARGGLHRIVRHTEDDFLLDVYLRPRIGETSRPSVARREGLV